MKGGRPGSRRHICHRYSPGNYRAWELHTSPPNPPPTLVPPLNMDSLWLTGTPASPTHFPNSITLQSLLFIFFLLPNRCLFLSFSMWLHHPLQMSWHQGWLYTIQAYTECILPINTQLHMISFLLVLLNLKSLYQVQGPPFRFNVQL